MIFWNMIILVIRVVGYRDQSQNMIFQVYYKDYENIYKLGQNLCPELHTHIPDMHPHQCVSYAEICKGVQNVEVKIALNGTQYLCHNRFQPWGAGKPTVDNVTFHCGFKDLDELQFQKQKDGHFFVTCVSGPFQAEKCLISLTVLTSRYCLFCKPPLYGKGCQKAKQGYDNRYTDPVRQCNYLHCKECNLDQTCVQCIDTWDQGPLLQCELDCLGFDGCSTKSGSFTTTSQCIIGSYYFSEKDNKCIKCTAPCQGCTLTLDKKDETCSNCEAGYALLVYKETPQEVFGCYNSQIVSEVIVQLNVFIIQWNFEKQNNSQI